jgi:hypothetical protein
MARLSTESFRETKGTSVSTFNDIDMECPDCGEEFRGTVWVAIHAGQDPQLKELLLGGELNLVSCPECAHVAFHDHFLIYQDPAIELIAYVYPEIQKREETTLRAAMLQGFKDATESAPPDQRPAYGPTLLFGLESLIELLQKEEEMAEQSDVAEAVCKAEKIPFDSLHPAKARANQAPATIPKSASQASRTSVLAGLDKLLALNPALTEYVKLRDRIAKDETWSIA